MTEAELNQLHWINKEISARKKELDELKSRSLIKGQEITGMPFGTGITDKTCNLAVAIREIEEIIEIKMREMYIVRARIERYINNIDDAEIRLIIRLRCINNMDWESIATEVGYERTTVSKKYRNYISHNSREK